MKSMKEAKRLKIAVWWCFPCKATSGIFRELANFIEVDVDVFLLDGMSENRARLGWHFPDYGNAQVLSFPEGRNHRKSFIANVDVSNYDIHLLNSIYTFEEFNILADRLIKEKIPFGVMTEATFNGFSGIKKYLKHIYTRFILPVRTRRRAQKSSFVMCLSGSSKHAIRNLMAQGFPKKIIFPFAYFLEEISTKEPRSGASESLKLLCTGYLTPNKGQHILIDALDRVFQATESSKVDLVITGFGPSETHLKKLVSEKRLEDRITFAGPVSNEELIRLYGWADILIAPGIEEPWGIRINEALQMGLPVVASDRIGASELVRHANAGKIFESGNSEALQDVIMEIIDNPRVVSEWQRNALTYRPRIHPSSAAQYLFAVILTTLDGTEVIPEPRWLV